MFEERFCFKKGLEYSWSMRSLFLTVCINGDADFDTGRYPHLLGCSMLQRCSDFHLHRMRWMLSQHRACPNLSLVSGTSDFKYVITVYMLVWVVYDISTYIVYLDIWAYIVLRIFSENILSFCGRTSKYLRVRISVWTLSWTVQIEDQ
jgi:hypothetical protein